MKALILAAGYATRLYPLTLNKSKALLDVNGKPIINYIIDKIPEEIDEMHLITNSKFLEDFRNWLKNDYKDSRKLEIIDDGSSGNENRLGGVGDMKFVVDMLGEDDYLVLVSDNIFDFSLEEALQFFKEKKKDMLIAYDIKSFEEAKKFGVLRLDNSSRIIAFSEKPAEPETTLVSTGIYFITKDSMSLLEGYLQAGNNKEGTGYFFKWLAERKEVYAFPVEGKWADIGSIETYEEAKRNF